MDLLEMHLWIHDEVRLAFLTDCIPTLLAHVHFGINDDSKILFCFCTDEKGVLQPVGLVLVLPPQVQHLALVSVDCVVPLSNGATSAVLDYVCIISHDKRFSLRTEGYLV